MFDHPRTPSLSINTSQSTILKAFGRSTVTRSVTWPTFTAARTSSITRRSAVWVLCPLLNPDWYTSMSLFLSTYSLICKYTMRSNTFDAVQSRLIGLKSAATQGSPILGTGLEFEPRLIKTVEHYKAVKSHYKKRVAEFLEKCNAPRLHKLQFSIVLERTFNSMNLRKILFDGFKRLQTDTQAPAVQHLFETTSKVIEQPPIVNKSELEVFEGAISQTEISDSFSTPNVSNTNTPVVKNVADNDIDAKKKSDPKLDHSKDTLVKTLKNYLFYPEKKPSKPSTKSKQKKPRVKRPPIISGKWWQQIEENDTRELKLPNDLKEQKKQIRLQSQIRSKAEKERKKHRYF
ncbi:hypothetical protein TKK_0013959 [Trichogramma kaykai]